MVSDGGPDPAGIFSGERGARRCWITQHGHMPPSLMAVCHLISALRTMVQCSVDALQLQFIHLLTRPQTPLTSSQRPKGDDTVEMEPYKSITKKSMLSFNCYDLIINVAIQVLVVL